jgi:hypothetical protein
MIFIYAKWLAGRIENWKKGRRVDGGKSKDTGSGSTWAKDEMRQRVATRKSR